MKIILLLCLLASLSGCMQLATEEDQFLEKAERVNLPQEKIVEKTLDWMGKNLKSTREAVVYPGEKQTTILGNGVIQVHFPMFQSGLMEFTMRIDIQNNEYKIQTYDYQRGDKSSVCENWYKIKDTSDQMNQEIAKLLQNLRESLAKS